MRTPTTRVPSKRTERARKTHEQIDACRLDLPGEPLREMAERDDVVAVVAKRGRRDRQAELVLRREEVDVVLANRRAERRAFALEIRDQLVQRGGIQQRARQGVRARLARLFDHGDRERLAALLPAAAEPDAAPPRGRRDLRRRSGHRLPASRET